MHSRAQPAPPTRNRSFGRCRRAGHETSEPSGLSWWAPLAFRARSSRPISAAKALASRRPTARSRWGASLIEKETDHMAKKHTAQCACGAVKFEFDTDPTFVAVHCLDCKKSSGGATGNLFASAK